MTNVRTKTVLIAAWEATRTRAWRRELVGSGEFATLRPAHSLADVQARLAQHPADLVITDLRLHDGLATHLVRMLRQRTVARRTPILVVAREKDPLLLDALQEGADGVLDQSVTGPTDITSHARDLLNGGVDIAPWIGRQLLDHFEFTLGPTRQQAPRPNVESITNPLELTETERKLLRNISIGKRLAEVAQSIGWTTMDCTARVRAIHRKMQWSLRAGDLSLQPG